MKKNYPSFIIIDHKNEIEIMDELRRTNETLILMKTVSIIGNNNLGKDIKNFFNEYIPDISFDFFNNSLKLCQKKNNKLSVYDSINRILNKKYENNKIKLTNNETTDLSLILSEIFYKINNQKKIRDKESFIKEIEKIKAENVDIISKYLLTNYNLTKYKKNETFIEQQSVSNQKSEEKIYPINQAKSFLNDFQIIENEYQFKEFKEDENSIIPIECKILIKKFQMIKKLIITIDNKKGDNVIDKNTINNTILVLLNINWLFCNIIDLEIDLSNEEIYSDYLLVIGETLNLLSNYSKKYLRNTYYSGFYNNKRIFDPFFEGKNDEDDDNYYNEKSELNISSYDTIFFSKTKITKEQFINKYSPIFELIVIYSYFISQIKNLLSISIYIPDEMEADIIKCLKKKKN